MSFSISRLLACLFWILKSPVLHYQHATIHSKHSAPFSSILGLVSRRDEYASLLGRDPELGLYARDMEWNLEAHDGEPDEVTVHHEAGEDYEGGEVEHRSIERHDPALDEIGVPSKMKGPLYTRPYVVKRAMVTGLLAAGAKNLAMKHGRKFFGQGHHELSTAEHQAKAAAAARLRRIRRKKNAALAIFGVGGALGTGAWIDHAVRKDRERKKQQQIQDERAAGHQFPDQMQRQKEPRRDMDAQPGEHGPPPPPQNGLDRPQQQSIQASHEAGGDPPTDRPQQQRNQASHEADGDPPTDRSGPPQSG